MNNSSAIIKVGDTAFECVVTLGRDLSGDDIVLTADFTLNGKKRTAIARMARWDYSKEAAVEEGQLLLQQLQSLLGGERSCFGRVYRPQGGTGWAAAH